MTAQKTAARETINVQDVVTHCLPCCLGTDNGLQVVSDHFKEYLEDKGIEHRRTTPLWPQANGTLKRVYFAQAEGRDWSSVMNNFLMRYRGTPHSTTGR